MGMGNQGKKRGRWSDTAITSSVNWTSLGGKVLSWGCCICSWPASATIWVHELSWLDMSGYSEWSGYSSLFPWRHISRCQCQDSSDSDCDRVVQGWWDIVFTHGSATRVQTFTPVRTFGMCWRSLAQWPDSPVIPTGVAGKWMQHWTEIDLDITEAAMSLRT